MDPQDLCSKHYSFKCQSIFGGRKLLGKRPPLSIRVGSADPGGVGLSPQAAPQCSQGKWKVTLDVTSLNKLNNVKITADHSSSSGKTARQAEESIENKLLVPSTLSQCPPLRAIQKIASV